MDLNEIEQAADKAIADVLGAEAGKNALEFFTLRLQALKDLATIKALAAGNEERSISVQLRERELAAMESVAAKIPTKDPSSGLGYLPTPAVKKLRAEVDRCAGLADEEFQAAEAWRGNDESRTATKNAGDFRAEVYTEVGQRLEQILREGGLL